MCKCGQYVQNKAIVVCTSSDASFSSINKVEPLSLRHILKARTSVCNKLIRILYGFYTYYLLRIFYVSDVF